MKNTIKKLGSKFKDNSRYGPRSILIWASLFAVVGVIALILTRAATPGITPVVDATLANPTNVKINADDRMATVTWDAPTNVGAQNIIGYYISWGAQAGGVYTNAKQTTYHIVQIQPLTNGTLYNVKVQSVQGDSIQVPTPDSWNGGTASEARANGKVSTGVNIAVTPSSARVDALRTQMTGFFDDFNTSAGALDELKWNTAAAGCDRPGSVGAFLNSQFHAHSQVRSSLDPYCDRSSVVTRARPVFDISGRTEADPGVIVGDFDGTFMQSGRDIWYIDLVPLAARKNNVPLDITSHADAGDTAVADPAMIRISQNRTGVMLNYTGNDKVPGRFDTYKVCPDFKNDLDFNGWCAGKIESGLANEWPVVPGGNTPNSYFPTPNVRYHWRVEISPVKVKVFLNGVRILEGPTPADFVNVTKYSVQSNLFSYNTGKDAPDEREQTSMLHWDNFGFNGPAPTTVVHNYLEGGATGTVPVVGTGSVDAHIQENNRATKIPIPDVVGNPQQARLMYTLQNLGSQNYTWKATDTVTVNGIKYPVPQPSTIEQAPHPRGDNVADAYTPYAESIILNPADIKKGNNDVVFSLDNSVDVLNVHIELEYTKGSEPAYTQPSSVFGSSILLAAIQPAMLSHDSYLFIEQDMGLPNGNLVSPVPFNGSPPTATPPPPAPLPAPSPAPTPVPAPIPTPVPNHFSTLGVNAVMPTEATCTSSVRAMPETRPDNAVPNATKGVGGNYTYSDVTGNYAGTTDQIIQWASCKHGMDEDLLRAQMAVESYWHQSGIGDFTTNAASCDPVYPIKNYSGSVAGDNALVGQCPESVGMAQVRWNYHKSAFYKSTTETTANLTNNAVYSTAYNVDYYAAVWRDCYNGNMTWLNTVDKGATYAAGDAQGCQGVWFAGRWRTQGALDYIAKVQDYLNNRIWETAGFKNHTPINPLPTNPNPAPTPTPTPVPADTTKPVVSITSPASGASVGGDLSVTANATDNIGVVKVELLVNGIVSVTDQVAPYSFNWNTASLPDGTYSLAAKAYDLAGNTQSATISVIVKNTSTPKIGDINGDAKVDIFDLSILLSHFSQTGNRSLGDLNNDGIINIFDLSILLSAWGN
jgi:hypothetical protein